MFFSDLLPEMNSFGGLEGATVGNCGKADLDKEGGPVVFFGWGLFIDTGCWTCGRKPLLEPCPLPVHGVVDFC